MSPTTISALLLLSLLSVNGQSPNSIADQLNDCYQSAQNKELFENCLKTLMQGLAAKFKTGIPELNVPVVDPMSIPEIDFQDKTAVTEINAVFRDIVVHGASNFKIDKILSDRVARKVFLNFTIPEMKVTGKYNMKGNVVLIPVDGSGNLWVVFTDVVAAGTAFLKRQGNQVLVNHTNVDFTIRDIKLKLDNLLSGDSVGDAVNQVLNDNSQEILQDIKPKVGERLGNAVTRVLNNAFTKLPTQALIE